MIYVAARNYSDFQKYAKDNNLDYINCEYVPSAVWFGKSKFNHKVDKVVLLPGWKGNKALTGLEREMYLAGVDMGVR